MKIVRITCRIIVGLVFIFSAFVKDIDPLGSAYKFIDYFEAFHISFLDFSALPLSILLCTVELATGINLLLGIRMRITSYILIIFMTGFTILTFFLAIFNPVSDCGCFGDAIILTNWQTFWKNIIIFLPAAVVFYSRKRYVPFYSADVEWRMTGAFVLLGILISVHCYRNLPIIDFRPYKTGANIPENMLIPEGAPEDEYETILVYEKDGIPKEFATNNFPWQDTTWKWVETKQKLIKKGYEPPIHNFTITTSEGYDITDHMLEDKDYSFLLIADDLTKTNVNAFGKIDKLAELCKNSNCSFYCLTSSTNEQIIEFKDEVNTDFDFYTTDEITLKTIIRSNPGLMLIREGNIIGKWHYNNFHIFNDPGNNFSSLVLDTLRKDKEKLLVWLFIVSFFLIICLNHMWLTARRGK
jgi:uncharacterized membrane protein YphA (DoxX/SURF4 family)